MKKIEAKTLEDAYSKASQEFKCSITELNCEIVQYPSSGFIGMFSKNAIIIVAKREKKDTNITKEKIAEKTSNDNDDNIVSKKVIETDDKTVIVKEKKKETIKPLSDDNIEKLAPNNETQTKVLDSFFDNDSNEKEVKTPDTEEEVKSEVKSEVKKEISKSNIGENNIELQEKLEKELKHLISLSCFNIDTVEVDVIEDTAYIFIDGDDAALLIGKEGYRYNAISYLISNWLQNKHKLYLKLEIAQFLASQQEMIRNYMEPVISRVNSEGWGRTRPLDGVLVQIALEQLREEFPNKYVAIKRTKSGEKYVLINEFNKR